MLSFLPPYPDLLCINSRRIEIPFSKRILKPNQCLKICNRNLQISITQILLRLNLQRSTEISVSCHNHWRIQEGAGDAPQVKILSFSCSFRQKKLQNNPTLGVGAPLPQKNPGSATDNLFMYFISIFELSYSFSHNTKRQTVCCCFFLNNCSEHSGIQSL